jgi:N-glycosylase/DNA lyase
MHYYQNGTETEVIGLEGFNLQRTFECGQCFRWNSDGTGAYVGVAKGKAARIRRDGGSVFITGTPDDFRAVWRVYFDLDRNYESIRSALCVDDYMKRCAQYGAGIRILKQDKWESLCTFIVSQCNNIPRIKQIVERFSRLFGEPVTLDGHTYYTFPTAERTALLSEKDLEPLRCGYRAPYILGAARAVAGGRLDLEALAAGEPDHAIDALKTLDGVGDKVARCVALFGLHILDAFPVDTWIKKAVTENYGDTFDPAVFSPYAGIAQQYMFHYARSKKS